MHSDVGSICNYSSKENTLLNQIISGVPDDPGSKVPAFPLRPLTPAFVACGRHFHTGNIIIPPFVACNTADAGMRRPGYESQHERLTCAVLLCFLSGSGE